MATIRAGTISDVVSIKPNDFGFVYTEDASNIIIGSESVILTYTVPASMKLYLMGGSTDSNWLAALRLEVDGANKCKKCLTYLKHEAVYEFPKTGLKVAAGEIVKVFATGQGDPIAGNITDQDYRSKIWGELRSV
jgi:hypothetical protein